MYIYIYILIMCLDQILQSTFPTFPCPELSDDVEASIFCFNLIRVEARKRQF